MELIEQFMAGDGWQKWVATAAILIIGYFVSLLLRGLVSGAINRTGIGKKAKTTGGNIGKSVGKAVFWLALLYTLFLALSRAGLGEYFGPVENLYATTSVLEAAQVDNLAARSGVTEATGSSNSLAKGLGTLVFVLIIVPVAVAALGALNMDEISVPLTNMLEGFTSYIPSLVGASLVLGGAIFIGRFISKFLFGGSLLKAAVLIAIGVFLASFMGRFMSTMMNPKLASFIKYFVIVLFVFLGLSSLDTTGQIVPVAFSAFVIAAAVAAAIAFGLGGRDWAKQVLSKTMPPADMSKLSGKK